MSTGQKRKYGIRCQHEHPDGNGPCDLLLMEKQDGIEDGIFGILDKRDHFTSIDVLYNEAIRRGWTPNTETTNETENTVTTETQTSHRYADQGQVQSLWAFGSRNIYGPPGIPVGSPKRANDNQDLVRAALCESRMYLFEENQEDEQVIITILDLSSGQVEIGETCGVFRITKEEAVRFTGSDREVLPLYEHEAEIIISDLQAIQGKEDEDPRRFLH